MSNIPIVKPADVKEYDFKQSNYEIAPRLPFSQIIIGPSGGGKGILLQSMILDIYRDVFPRIYIYIYIYIFGLLQSQLMLIGHQLKSIYKTT